MLNILIRYILVTLLLIGSSLFLEEGLIGIWYSCIGLPLFGAIESSTFFDCISCGVLVLSVLWCCVQTHSTPKRLMICFSVYILFYSEFRIIGNTEYDLVPFKCTFLNWLVYADIVPIIIVIYWISSRGHKKGCTQESSGRNSLYFEDSIEVDDLLDHRTQAKTLAFIIKTEYAHSENAVGIAVTGEWGAGKSTFLSYMKEALTDCICIQYDPWTENSDDITTDLLDRIECGISQKDIRLGKTFKRYAEKVNVTNVTGWFSLLMLTIRNFFDYSSEAEQRTHLRKALKSQEKPIVVFIDDSDRLPNGQFLKTISIIRGVADLPNVVFVVAFDQQRANEKLKSYGGKDFMRKLFNVIHPLQPIAEEVILNEIAVNIATIFTAIPEERKVLREKIYETFDEIPIKQCLPTLREVKRFCNVIEKDYSLIKDTETDQFVDQNQWLKVELLKYIDITLFTMVGANPEKYLKQETQFGLNSPYYVLKEDAVFDNPASSSILHNLFYHRLGQHNDTVVISNPYYFRLYFGGSFPDDYISFKIYQEYILLEDDSREMCRAKAEALKKFINENWAYRNETNIESIVCEILKTYPVDLLYPLLETIVDAYITKRKGKSFRELGEQDNYRKYSHIVIEHPFLSVLSFWLLEEFCTFDGHEAADESCILKSPNPLIHCALFNNQIRNCDYNGRIVTDGYLFELLKRLVSENKHQDVIWAVADCISADLQKSFLNEYLQCHLLDCLPYLLWWKVDNDTGEKFIYADIPAIEGLFLSIKDFKRTLTSFHWHRTYDVDLLMELRRLVDLSYYVGIKNEYFKISSFPILEHYLLDGQRLLSENLIKSETFWLGGDRIEEVVEYYLA